MGAVEPTIFVVDDDPAVRKAVSRLLRACGFNVCAIESAALMLEQYVPTVHGCIVLDVAMPGLNGLDFQQELVSRGGSLPIIFLTGHGDIPMSVRAMKQGAADFLTKPVQRSQLIEAVKAAVERDRAAYQERAELAEVRRRLATLTPREHEVLRHVVAGKLNKQTAAELGTVEKTVKVHRARVMQKMNVTSLAELVQIAGRAGVTVPSVQQDPELD
jgi:FixJ family two-component response regulator